MAERMRVDPCYCIHAYLNGASDAELLQMGCIVEVHKSRRYDVITARAKNGHHYVNCSMVLW